MARFLGSLFGSQKPTQAPATTLRVQTALQGVPIPIILGGQNRLGNSLLWYGAFFSQQNYNGPGGAGGGQGKGKGGIGGGKGSQGTSGSTTYFASVLLAVCEGPIETIGNFYINGSLTGPLGVPPPLGATGSPTYPYVAATIFDGTYTQDAWSWGASVSPSQAQNYRGIAYVGIETLTLGSSPNLPVFTFEIYAGVGPTRPSGSADEDPAYCLQQFLTNQFWGLQFPSYRLSGGTTPFNQYSNYCRALGLLASPILVSSVQASSIASDIMDATNSEAVWSSGLLNIVPRGDQALSNGTILQVAETHIVPAGSLVVTTFIVSIQIGNPGTFVSDGGVTYLGTGQAFTFIPLSTLLAVGQFAATAEYSYDPSKGIYYFSTADTGNTVVITYYYVVTGAGFSPQTQPFYLFTTNDFLENQATIGQGLSVKQAPLLIVRKPRDQMLNNIKVEYLDRSNSYNPVDIEVKDEASIIAFGRERPSEIKQWHFYCIGSAAQQAASLALIKEQIARTYQWTCGKQFILLDPMDVVAVSDPGQGVVNQLVRIVEIQENQDFSLTFTAEEYPGVFTAPQFGFQGAQGPQQNYNEAPGAIATPIVFEPTASLGAVIHSGVTLSIAVGLYGTSAGVWGGAQCFVSYDGVNYTNVGIIPGPSRMGVTTQDLPVVTFDTTAPTVDQTNTLAVNLSASMSTLGSASVADALSGNSLCWVEGEVLSYVNATLTSANNYALTYLVRAQYNTQTFLVDHPTGSRFLRLDRNIVDFPFDASRVGDTIFLKFCSFNIYGGGLQQLSQVPAYTYVIQGTALTVPLPQVTNLAATYQNGNYVVSWDQVTDFRTGIRYQLKSGSTYASAVLVADLAHGPYNVQGDGTYWVVAYVQPLPNLIVYSSAPTSLVISGSLITSFIAVTYNAQANLWNGTFTGNAGYDNSLNAARTGSAGNILAITGVTNPPNGFLSVTDVLNFGGGTGSGTFIIPASAYFDLGSVQQLSPQFVWTPTGVPVGQNILAISNILTVSDILGAASAAFVNVYPIISLATDGVPTWGAFQKWVPGVQVARWCRGGIFLNSTDPNTIAYCLQMIFSVTIPGRIDHVITNTNLSAAAQTYVFKPDATPTVPSPTNSPFKGGPNGATVPAISVSYNNTSGGIYYVISGLTLSQMTITFFASGTSTPAVAASNVTIIAEGY
jgi:hypothetical protein